MCLRHHSRHQGGCIEGSGGYDACNAHSASESTCLEYTGCHFCEVEGLCKNSDLGCILCEYLDEEYCDYGLTCYWCLNKNMCLDDDVSCTCGDGYLLVSEECDDAGESGYCVDCECIEGTEPDGTGSCAPICDPVCEYGWCTDINTCTCYMGWTGDICDTSACDPDPCEYSCSEYNKDNCDLYETCQWCKSTQSCMESEDDCPACNEFTDEATCDASDGYCRYCSGATTDPCRRSTVACTCFDGEYDILSDNEQCEDDLGDSNCTNCKCAAGTVSDKRGGCVEGIDYDACNAHSASESACSEYENCYFCEVEGVCKNVEISCILCEYLPDEEYCSYGLTCHWCSNQQACLDNDMDCYCGDGTLLESEECDDGIDPDYCEYCSCIEGYEPDGAGSCTPVCDPACVEGTCTAPDVCECDDGWEGSICDTPICDPDCVEGTCTAPGVCECNDGWIGDICDEETCYPKCDDGYVCETTALTCYLPGALVINEMDIDQPDDDTAEFIEIKNTSDETVNTLGYVLLLIDGETGDIYTTIELYNFNLDPGEYYVICNSFNVDNCTHNIHYTTDDFIQNGSPDAIAIGFGNTIIDTVSYGGDSPYPFTEGSGVGLLDDDSFAKYGLSRYPDGRDTDSNNVDFSGRCITPGEENTDFSEHCKCGNERINLNYGEECDDGNRENLDGCDENCFIEPNYCETEDEYRCVENVLEICDQNLWTVVEDCSNSNSTCEADEFLGDCVEIVDGDEEVIDGDEEEVIDGDEEEVIDGDEEEVIDGDEEEVIDGDEEEVIDGDEEEVIDGDEEKVVDGDEEEVIDGDEIDGDESGIFEDVGCNMTSQSANSFWFVGLIAIYLIVIRRRRRKLFQ